MRVSPLHGAQSIAVASLPGEAPVTAPVTAPQRCSHPRVSFWSSCPQRDTRDEKSWDQPPRRRKSTRTKTATLTFHPKEKHPTPPAPTGLNPQTPQDPPSLIFHTTLGGFFWVIFWVFFPPRTSSPRRLRGNVPATPENPPGLRKLAAVSVRTQGASTWVCVFASVPLASFFKNNRGKHNSLF